MREKEFIGEINGDIFSEKVKEFSNKFGKPELKKRLGLMVFDRNNSDVDTRVRITNGKAEVMQKVKVVDDGSGLSIKKEISIPLLSNTDVIYNAYVSYLNLLKSKYSEKLISLAVQTENYIWELSEMYGVELKISYQFGINDYYTFEIEAVKDGVDLEVVRNALSLSPTANHASDERKLFRSTQVDLNLLPLSEEQVKEIISKYVV